MSGFLTNQRLWGATTFVDHVSDYTYVHLMKDLSLPETLLAKSAMEKIMAQAGRTVKHYHADNGRFADNGLIDAVNGKDQNISSIMFGHMRLPCKRRVRPPVVRILFLFSIIPFWWCAPTPQNVIF